MRKLANHQVTPGRRTPQEPVSPRRMPSQAQASFPRSLLVVAGVLLASLLGFFMANLSTGTSSSSKGQVSQILGVSGGINWDLPSVDGGQSSFAQNADKPTILFLSSSFCVECRGEVAKLARMHDKYKSKGAR